MTRGVPRDLKPQPEWMLTLRVGDVLRARSGLLRVVREVSWWNRDPVRLHCVTFAIKNCSWTGRPYTIMSAQDLLDKGYTKIGANYKLKSKQDAKLFLAIHNHENRSMTCCDVQGMP